MITSRITPGLCTRFVGGRFYVHSLIGTYHGEVAEVQIDAGELLVQPKWLSWMVEDGTFAEVESRPFCWCLTLSHQIPTLTRDVLAMKMFAEREHLLLVGSNCPRRDLFVTPSRFTEAA